MEAPTKWAQRLLTLLFLSCDDSSLTTQPNGSIQQEQRFLPKGKNKINIDENGEDKCDSDEEIKSIYQRQIVSSHFPKRIRKNFMNKKIVLWIQPPQITTSIDRIFNQVVNQVEHDLIQKQTLSAWMSTLGGGYFFCRRLSRSLILSQQQQAVARQLNNHSLVQQCQINEIFNWLYAGQFQIAKMKISQLENEITTAKPNGSIDDNTIITNKHVYQQCQAARILLKRLRKFQRKLKKYHTKDHGTIHTIDDYQRIRLVQDDDPIFL